MLVGKRTQQVADQGTLAPENLQGLPCEIEYRQDQTTEGQLALLILEFLAGSARRGDLTTLFYTKRPSLSHNFTTHHNAELWRDAKRTCERGILEVAGHARDCLAHLDRNYRTIDEGIAAQPQGD